jgi:branched-chain amino acid transport system substrate-binding protein
MASAAGAARTPPRAAAAAVPPPPGGWITNFVRYVHGKARAANPKLAPVTIGFASNNGGGTVQSLGPEATAAAQTAVKWLNEYAGGVDGHPLQLNTCIILNSEEEGLSCAEKFLDNPKIDVITYGALSVGAATIDSTVAGKKPIISAFALNPSDITAKHFFALFGAGGFSLYPIGTFAKQYLHAKTAAVIYPDEAGQVSNAASVALADKAAGIATKLVDFNPTSTDLTGALTAAGAQTAGMVFLAVSLPSNCLAAFNSAIQLGINMNHVIGYANCEAPQIQSQYPGGDYPHYISSESQSGDNLISDPTGLAFKKALTQVGAAADYTDDWYSAEFGQILTIAEFMNNVGYARLSPATVLAQVEKWKGPLLLGGPAIQCGKYRFAPGSCADGNYFFQYLGHGNSTRVSGWIEPPSALQAYLKKLPVGSGFPSTFP